MPAIEPANLTRPEVATLLNLQPKQVREFEVYEPSFPRGVPVGHVLALRWRRGEIIAWAAAHRGEVALQPGLGGRP